MNALALIRAAAGLLGAFFAASCLSQTNTRTLTALSATIGVTVKLSVVRDPPCIYDPTAYGWGVENSCPREMVAGIEVEQHGRRLIVPLSSFSDLAEPHSLRLRGKGPRDFSVLVVGGDAATSYTAVLRFSGDGVASRTVRSGEFPSEANETTTYRYNLGPR